MVQNVKETRKKMRPTNCQKKCDKTQNNRQKGKQTKRGIQNKKPKIKNVDTKKKERKTKRGTEKKKVKINWPTKVGVRKG